MIPKGNTHPSGVKLARYLLTAKPGERVQLYELRGFASADLVTALHSGDVLARGTHCRQPWFHVQVRNHHDDHALTHAEWEGVADRIGQKLGLVDQPRAMVFHIDEATQEKHLHLAFSRIDPATMKAIPQPFYKERLREVAQEMEEQYGLTRTRVRRDAHEVRTASRNEEEQSRRLGVESKAIRQTIRDAYAQADNGRSLQAALAEHDLMLARGDKRAFVIVDYAGGVHGLNKRLVDHTAPAIRVKLADLAQLPSIEEARALLRDRAAARTHAPPGEEENVPVVTSQEMEEPQEAKGKEMGFIDKAFQRFENGIAAIFGLVFGADNVSEPLYQGQAQTPQDVRVRVSVEDGREAAARSRDEAPAREAAPAPAPVAEPVKEHEPVQAAERAQTPQAERVFYPDNWRESRTAADKLEAQRLNQLRKAENEAWSDVQERLNGRDASLADALRMPTDVMEQVRQRAKELEAERQREQEISRGR